MTIGLTIFMNVSSHQIMSTNMLKSKWLTVKLLTFLLFLVLPLFVQAQPDIENGKTLFRNQCGACHAKDMKSKLTGPALGGSEERWGNQEELYSWIRNSQAMIADGHPRANELWNQYKPVVMTPFPNLTDDEIASILLYVNGVYTGTYGAPTGVAAAPGAVVEEESSNTIYFILLGVLIILALLLSTILSNLNYLSKRGDGEVDVKRKTLFDTLTSKGVIAFVIFALVVLGGYTTVNNAINLGRQQGYAPEQPIKFSHAVHAGTHKIDCQYCHDGARRSKQSVIPAASTCMNCHKAIKVGSQYGTGELTKIFASIGYDPSTDKYIENYDNLTEEQIEAIYKKWIGDQYVLENGGLDKTGEEMMVDQWDEIKTSLTSDLKKKIQGPIEWIRIHNLPDHAYFNHAQHVSIGKVECQTCHGKVEEMETVRQYSPLSMGWCINCHRQTEVKFNDNEYYQNYIRYHEELKSGKRTGVTVEEIGGLECQKCHY